MDKNQGNLIFTLHKSITFILIMVAGLLLQYFPPSGWGPASTLVFFLVSQVSFYSGILMNMQFNGYGVYEQVNKITGVTVVPDFGLTWNGFAVKPLAHSWTFNLMINTALVAVAIYFLLFEKESVIYLVAPVLTAYASAKLIALAGEVYVWMMADRHRHWYLLESRLHSFLLDKNHPPEAIEVVLESARQEGLLITR